MSASIKWDRQGFGHVALQLSLVKRQACSKTLRQESRLFVRDCAAMTPPIGPNPIQEFSASREQLKRGEKAVSKDFNRIFVSAKGLKILESAKDPKMQRDLDKAIKYGRVQDVDAILKAMGLHYASVELEARAEYLDAHRNERGRVMKGYRQFILRSQSMERIRKQKIADVGKAKAGWVRPAEALGLHLPAWITRHKGQPGDIKDESDHPLTPSITISNLVAWAQQFEGRIGIIERALALRVSSMKKRVELLIKKGY